jgi:hypothetical protein
MKKLKKEAKDMENTYQILLSTLILYNKIILLVCEILSKN